MAGFLLGVLSGDRILLSSEPFFLLKEPEFIAATCSIASCPYPVNRGARLSLLQNRVFLNPKWVPELGLSSGDARILAPSP